MCCASDDSAAPATDGFCTLLLWLLKDAGLPSPTAEHVSHIDYLRTILLAALELTVLLGAHESKTSDSCSRLDWFIGAQASLRHHKDLKLTLRLGVSKGAFRCCITIPVPP